MPAKFKPAFAFSFLNPLYDIGCGILGMGKPFSEILLGILEKNGLRDNQKVLDVGCGSGTFLATLKKKLPGVMVTGLDPDSSMLRIAGKKLAKIGATAELIPGFVQDLPFPEATLDFVVSSLVFHHLSPDVKKRGAIEVGRVLKPGGLFLLADIGKQESKVMRCLFTAFSTLDGQSDMRDNLQGLVSRVLTETGFDVGDPGSHYRGVEFLIAKKIAT